MANITKQPVNPHNNTTPYVLNDKNYAKPADLLALVQGRAGVPKMVLDQIETDCLNSARNSWMGFLDMNQMSIGFNTNTIEILEHKTPDYVIGGGTNSAVNRAANVFTIVPANIVNFDTGTDFYFFRENDVVTIYDADGNKETGVITSVADKATFKFTAVSRETSDWSKLTANSGTSKLTIDVIGSDFHRQSCGPEGLLELRKTKATTLRMTNIKDAMQYDGGDRYAFCFPGGEVKWYDDNTLELDKRLNVKVAKTLLTDVQSAAASSAYAAGYYGTQGLFAKIKAEGLNTNKIATVADLREITAYYDALGINTKEFAIHCDIAQYQALQSIADLLGQSVNINMNINLENRNDNMWRFGFAGVEVDGYTFHFTKWDLTSGNSSFSRDVISSSLPHGMIMPLGTVKTKINGVERQVPYIFKAYQNMNLMPGEVRTMFTGAFAPTPTNDCEYLKVTKSTTVGLGVPCPEVLTIINKA